MASRDDIWKEIRGIVNITADELDKWLKADESKQVGQKDGGEESTGYASGRRIVAILDAILKTMKSELTDDDFAHMRKVVAYAKRRLAQRPSGDVRETACS